ncbi:MAG TPA: hypothetical protein VIF35_00070 [Streptosporangiaceae bacterium]|jgi:hypothetical protein
MRASSPESANSAQLNGHHEPDGQPGAPTRGILRRGAGRAAQPPGPRYKWIALSNTTLGVLMATVNASIMLIALPDIFRGIGVDPLQPGNTSLVADRGPHPAGGRPGPC